MLKDAAALGDRLVLRGDFTAPDLTTLPRLVGTLAKPFGEWWERDRCSTYPTLATMAKVALTLEDAGGNVVTDLVVPVRYGIDIEIVNSSRVEVGQATWRIIGPAAEDYEYPRALTTWSGIPGTFEIELRGHYEAEGAVGLAPIEASVDRALRLRFFTSHGVREFRVPSPSPVPTLSPAQAQACAIERANDCEIFSSLLHRVKALQVLWLPRPPEGLEAGQHWHVMVGGLGEGRRLRAWDVERHELLADVVTLPALSELSLVVPPERPVRSLQVTLDDTPLKDAITYRREASAVVAEGAAPPGAVLIRQTPLYPTGVISLGVAAATLQMQRSGSRITLIVGAHDARLGIDFDVLTPSRYALRTLESDGAGSAHALRSVDGAGGEPGSRGVTVDAVFEPRGTRAPGRYVTRPWYDRGEAAGDYFARLSDDGTAVEVYRRGRTREAWPVTGREAAVRPDVAPTAVEQRLS